METYGLEQLGITAPALCDRNSPCHSGGEGAGGARGAEFYGALCVNTGKYTDALPTTKFIVDSAGIP